MRRDAIDLLRSPDSGGQFEVEVMAAEGDEVAEARLVDRATGELFSIKDGIADLRPLALRRAELSERQSVTLRERVSAEGPLVEHQTKQIDFFARYHDDYEKQVTSSPYYRALDRTSVVDWARRMPSGSRILEIGCGSGRQTLQLASLGMRVVGLDLSDTMLQLTRAKLQARGLTSLVDLVRSTGEALPVVDGCFDAVALCGTLHHVADPATVLMRTGSALRSGGMFFMFEPHHSPVRFLFDWSMRLIPLWEEEAADDPLFTEEQLRAWLERANISSKTRISTYLPPHLFYWLGPSSGEQLLRWSDRAFSAVPGIRRFGGVVICEGIKRAANSAER